jgi:hypothetical protein
MCKIKGIGGGIVMFALKKVRLYIIILIVFSISLAVYCFCMNNSQNNCVQLFNEKKIYFLDSAKSILATNMDFYLYKMPFKTLFRYNGEETNLSDAKVDDKTRSLLLNIVKELNLKSIDKKQDYIEFSFIKGKSHNSIVYTKDIDNIYGYTKIEKLDEDWYYVITEYE